MRIAIFSNTFLPTISGVVRSIASYKAALEDLGHEVHVFTQGARAYRDPEPNVHRYFSLHPGLPNDLPVTIPFSPKLDRLLREMQPDVIHAQHPVLLGNLAQRKARQLGVPLVYTLHAQYWQYGVYMPFKFLERPYNRLAAARVKRFMLKCDHIIAPSESLRDLIVGEFGITRPVTVIPTGIDMNSFDASKRIEQRRQLGWEDSFVVISAGRLAPEKNWPDLIQAVAQVIEGNPQVKLVLLGDGPSRDDLERQAAALGISDKVEFTGLVPYHKVPGYLIAADLFAFASETETQGLVTLEALAAGLPAVAYDAIGTRDVVADGLNGILTRADSRSLAAGIESLLNDPSQFAELQRGALKSAEKMDIRLLAKKLVGVYESSIDQMQRQLQTN